MKNIMNGGHMPLTSIDDKVVRVDAEAKARGEVKYIADYSFPDMLYAYMVRSSVPRGRILDIHMPELPDGYYFISAKDIPENGKNELWMIQKDWRCFADGDVRYVGETIGLLVGPDRNILSYLLDNTKIDYEEEVPAVSIDDAPLLKGGPIYGEDNILCSLYREYGFYKESLVSVNKKGMEGAAEIKAMMERFRQDPPAGLGNEKVVEVRDYKKGYAGLPSSDVLQFFTEKGSKVTVRPSGTEPKIKFYFGLCLPWNDKLSYADQDKAGMERIEAFKKDLGL